MQWLELGRDASGQWEGLAELTTGRTEAGNLVVMQGRKFFIDLFKSSGSRQYFPSELCSKIHMRMESVSPGQGVYTGRNGQGRAAIGLGGALRLHIGPVGGGGEPGRAGRGGGHRRAAGVGADI